MTRLSVALILASIIFGLVTPRPVSSDSLDGAANLFIDEANGDVIPLHVEIAATPTEQGIGLSGRAQLAPAAGMYFEFDHDDQYHFWMHGTSIPLSIAFIDDAHRIIDIQDMAPETETHHYPPVAYRDALEVNQGFFTAHHVRVGDTVVIDTAGSG